MIRSYGIFFALCASVAFYAADHKPNSSSQYDPDSTRAEIALRNKLNIISQSQHLKDGFGKYTPEEIAAMSGEQFHDVRCDILEEAGVMPKVAKQ